MPTAIYRFGLYAAAGACLFLLFLIAGSRDLSALSDLTNDTLGNFKTMFLSIILEALPFVLLGVLVSAFLQHFVSEETVRRLVPRQPLAAVLFACLLGILFPVCECGMIPIVRRLLKKGMPVYVAVVFILAGPVLNPVVYMSTYLAFRSHPEIAYARMGLAFAVAVFAGLALYAFLRGNPLRDSGGSHVQAHAHDHHHDHTNGNKLTGVLSHASDEFFEMGKYLIIGSLLAAGFHTFVARESIVAIGEGTWSSNLFMLGFAYILSICSTSDAFVASSFASSFSKSSLLTFLVFGPMMDVKGTLMLLSVFRARFVLTLILLVAAAVLTGSLLLQQFIFGGREVFP